jgi:hypothetical protein
MADSGTGYGRAPGLVHARCAHRGTTLYYGKVEARGIRCCYHGWLVGEFIDADDTSIGSGGAAVVPCNWLQHFENVMHPFHVPILHVPILHGTFSGTQFTEAMSRMPTVTWDVTERGVKSLQVRAFEGGQVMHRVTEVVLPTLRVVANPYVGAWSRVESLGWTLPIDDTHYRIYTAGRVRERGSCRAAPAPPPAASAGRT